MKADTIVVGLGNPILGDDGVGWKVAESVREAVDDPGVEVLCLSLGGLALMEHLAGYRRAVIVDAMTTGAAPGSLHRFSAREPAEPDAWHTASVHDLSLRSALAFGREMGLDLPVDIRVVGVEARPQFEFGDRLGEAVRRAVPLAVAAVLDSLQSRDD